MTKQSLVATMALSFLAFTLSALPIKTAQAGCRWDGTAPFCEGKCRPGEITKRRISNIALGDEGSRSFGKACATGTKAYCCTREAAPIPTPAPDKPSRARDWMKERQKEDAPAQKEAAPVPPCPEGQIRRKGTCQEVGVLPGSTTGKKGGFIQMKPKCPSGKTYNEAENACVATAAPAAEDDNDHKHKKKKKKRGKHHRDDDEDEDSVPR